MAQPKDFREKQGNTPFILNGRPASASGPPITIYDPIFARFADGIESNIAPAAEDIAFVHELSGSMCSLFDDEKTRRDSLQVLLSNYLDKTIVNYGFGNTRATDGSIMFTKGAFEVPLMSIEVKQEFGLGRECAYIQSTLYYLEFIKKLWSKKVASRLPVFLMFIAGIRRPLYYL